jgi:hypothetical protein
VPGGSFVAASNLRPQDALPSLAVAIANRSRALIYKIRSHRHCHFNRSCRTASASTHAEMPLARRLIELWGPSSRYGGGAYQAAESRSKVLANVGGLET